MPRLLCVLPLILLLAACAPAIKQQAAGAEDDAKPNINSVSQYLYGKITQPQDPVLAESMFSLAHYFDPGSRQLKRELLHSRLLLQSQGQQANPLQHHELMLQGQKEGLITSDDLANALDFYDKRGYAAGIEWVLEELESHYRDAFGLLTLCNYRHRQDAITDKKLIKEILSIAPDKEYYSFALAALHYQSDPQQALSLIKKYPESANYAMLMLEILIAKEDYPALSQLFDSYRYPEDAPKMQNFISRMRSLGHADIVMNKSAKIIGTQDKLTIAMLSELAFYTDNRALIHQISDFLTHSIEEHKADANVAPSLLAFAIQNMDDTLPLAALCLRLDSLSSAVNISHLYLYRNLSQFQSQPVAAKEEFNRRVQRLIPDPPLAALLMEISYNEAQNQEHTGSLRYAYKLVQAGKGGKDEINMALGYSHEYLGNDELIQVLEHAIQLFPQESGYQNDLGYTLLESLPWDAARAFNPQQNLDFGKAERLILSAYRQSPDSASIIDSRLWLHYRKQEYAAALALWQKLQNEQPDLELSSEVLYHAGMILLKNGDFPAAKECLAQMPGNDDFAQKLREALSEMNNE